MADYKLTELMVVRCAKEIKDGEVVFVGVGLPIMVAAYAFATHAPNMIMLTEGGAIRATAPEALAITVDDPAAFTGGDATFGMLATMAALQRGEVDVAFIGGAQIDKYGNINSTGAGDWTKKESFTYFAGSGGANDMATSGKRVLAIMPQDKKKFVEKCEYITTPGYLGGPGEREKLGMIGGGPDCVVSTMGVYRFDENPRRCTWQSTSPASPWIRSRPPAHGISRFRRMLKRPLRPPRKRLRSSEPLTRPVSTSDSYKEK